MIQQTALRLPPVSFPLPGPARPTIPALLRRFEPIRLAEMDGVQLMDRMEVKYVLTERQLATLLPLLRAEYRVLEIGGVREHRYRTLYFDTPECALYHAHHAGHRPRFKIRSRTYEGSGLAFVEVKHKYNRDRTIKRRVRSAQLATWLTGGQQEFVGQLYLDEPDHMVGRLLNDFRRVTLVSLREQVRVTLDLGLGFQVMGEGKPRRVGLPGIVVAEVKQERTGPRAAFMARMQEQRIPPRGFSKYAIGSSLLFPELKQNNFKSTHRLLAGLMQGELQ